MKSKIEHYEKRCGGVGTMHIERLLSPEELGEHVKMYAQVTIDPHSSLGYHLHDGDSETYYILQGCGSYNDNGSIREVHPGDVTYTPSGCSHGLENNSDEPLIFMALIIKA